jgi:arylsulfatase A-like enzyme/Flp pilus assembly protein TadD
VSRNLVKGLVLGLFLVLEIDCRREPPPSSESLVLVTIDTLRADRVGVYGGDVATPNLDRIAREGAHAENAFAQVPLTRPSHLSLFTGRYPFEHGVRQNVSPRFEVEMPLLAEILGRNGFRTAGFISSLVVSSESGLDRGFETFSDDFGEGGDEALFLDSVQRRGDETTDEAIAWLRENALGRFFLWVHLYDPHDPYEPPEPYASRYPGRPYEGEVAYSDELVGRLDRALGELGVAEKTLLVVTSDHGEAFEEHGETGHGYFIYDTTLRVPLILRGPGIPAGGEIESPVESVDLLPTIAELLGIALPESMHLSGRSLARALRGGDEPEPKPIYAESLMPSLLYGWGEVTSIREGPWKLIESPKAELYNLEEDPHERDNRIEQNHGARDRLRSRLDALAPEGSGTALTGEIDPELAEKLGALGYVGSVRGGAGANPDIDPKDKLAEFRFLNGAMREGLSHLQEKRYQDAIDRFRAVLASGTESPQALYFMGRALHGLGRYEEAVSAFEGSLALDPAYSPGYLDLAEAHFAMGQEEEAVGALRRGQETLKRSAVLYEREGEYWAKKRRPREAARAFAAVVERVPEDALARMRLGEHLRDLGEIEKSLEHMREAVRLSPDDASYWNSLGMVLGGNGRPQEAEEAFRRAIELDPGDARYSFNLGLVLAGLGRVEEARSFFRSSLEANPEFAPARAELQKLERR